VRPRVIQRVTGAQHIEQALALGGSGSRVLTPDTPSSDSTLSILNPAVSAWVT
jgi:hypothetical protein